MGDGFPDTMNLDLNLGPVPEAGSGSISAEAMNLDDWIDNSFNRIRDNVRHRRWRWQQVQIPTVTQNMSIELDQVPAVAQNMSLELDRLPSVAHNLSEFDRSLENLSSIGTLQAGEGSVAAEERINVEPKMCENNNGFLEDNVSEKNDDVEKGSGNDGSFFDCNVCLDLAKDPVVTCCGHLFCWSCLYRWLHIHSDAKECPVCKGEVTMKTVTPIYGRGNASCVVEDESGLKIPPRPNGRRVESLRQTIQRTAFGLPVEEMIRRIGRFDLPRDSTPPWDTNGTRDTSERTHSFINRVLTSRGMRAEQYPAVPVEEVDLTQNSTAGHEVAYRSMLIQRQAHLRRAARISSLSSALSSAERLVEAYFRSNPAGRNQDQAPPVDDRDSFSSIVAVINSESQMDTAAEIDSVVSLSTTSTSRRRSDSSRVSDMDSGDSRAPRRRRLN